VVELDLAAEPPGVAPAAPLPMPPRRGSAPPAPYRSSKIRSEATIADWNTLYFAQVAHGLMRQSAYWMGDHHAE
jgi:hypothetical protein